MSWMAHYPADDPADQFLWIMCWIMVVGTLACWLGAIEVRVIQNDPTAAMALVGISLAPLVMAALIRIFAWFANPLRD